MIGQISLKANIDNCITNGIYPRFSIFVGPEGSGKRLMCKYVAEQLGLVQNVYGTTVDDVRTVISEAYKIATPILYVLPNADKMSPAAKNALLKVTEEPPQNAYFAITLQDLNNTLATIRSRGSVFYMNPYTVDELLQYGKECSNYTMHDEEADIVSEVCETPGEVATVLRTGAVEFYSYAEKVVDNIAVVSGANSFKIAAQIKLKDTDEDKYDLKLFWKAFMSICATRLKEDPLHYASGIRVTSKYLQELRVTGINKASTFDMWLLDVRKEWM